MFRGLQELAEVVKTAVEKEETEATKKALETQDIAADAQRDLGKIWELRSCVFN